MHWTNILLNASLGFLTNDGFVSGMLLILQNLDLFLILLVSLDEKFLEWEPIRLNGWVTLY